MGREAIVIFSLVAAACARFGPSYDAQVTSVTLALEDFDSLEAELEILADTPGAEESKASVASAKEWIARGRAALEDERPQHAAMYLERLRSQLDLVRLEVGKARLEQDLNCELRRQNDLKNRVEELEGILNRDQAARSKPEDDS